jgi:hypothetical protein
MKNITALIICLACAVVAFLVLGFNYFALYQLLPIAIFYVFQLKVFKKINRSNTAAFICYILAGLILLVFPLTAQLMWYFDVNNLASKSSTSGLLFVWLPIYAVLPGIIVCSLAWIMSRKSIK